MSLCEENCELISYDNIYRKAKCSCKVKTSLSLDNIELDNKNILKNFIDIKKITNIEIVKCYKIVFNINNIKSNYCSFIILFIFILYFISLIIFYLVNYYDINENIFDVNFHILDFINHKINKLNQLNVEINALDQLVFNKILNLIYNNQDLTILKFSFFSLISHTLEGPC